MKIIRDAKSMRAWSLAQRTQGRSVGLVPTMGALHQGHGSLLQACAARDDARVISIFVNPTQFAPNEDFDAYPRTFDADVALAEEVGMDVVYAPTASTMYARDYSTFVEVDGVSVGLCAQSRPRHFRGVATVVAKLLNAVLPDHAYFGQKDAQQCAVIRRMVRDLDMGVGIVELPIIREADGLALSSRNKYLNAEERQRGTSLSRALEVGRALMEGGEDDAEVIVRQVADAMADVKIDYVALVDAESIEPVTRVERPVLLAVAAYVGKTRLIDNTKYFPPVSDGAGVLLDKPNEVMNHVIENVEK